MCIWISNTADDACMPLQFITLTYCPRVDNKDPVNKPDQLDPDEPQSAAKLITTASCMPPPFIYIFSVPLLVAN